MCEHLLMATSHRSHSLPAVTSMPHAYNTFILHLKWTGQKQVPSETETETETSASMGSTSPLFQTSTAQICATVLGLGLQLG